MQITATHINYYFVCKRKLWLFSNGISMEHTSENVKEGKLLHETSYPQRAERYREIEVSFPFNTTTLLGKIDFYDVQQNVIHEIKKNNTMEDGHVWQIKFYMWLTQLNGFKNTTGILEYPLLKTTKNIAALTLTDIETLNKVCIEISEIAASNTCPPVIQQKICKKCAYYELCYVTE
ncbi:MAG: CRISPR-associated protein Cas4 [Hydrotalea sp. AMD]|uniref:CRISPR-associated protein Cas4 n=1 Tax=Hydrotalea sp. AMD TaxID=2501297 RepID=UPI0009430E22|nr:CRISPR-associated protein Cas4 [Hydrotalea sp. AMD]RWZ90754.1 MAG: CRISPR-associated protein Cas4 [Hydrotalea sp. AMD]